MKKLDKKSIENILALTPLQEGMLFHYLKDPEGAQYAEQLCLNISGQLDNQCFKRAWDVVTGTNEMLRTLFRWEKLEKPTQIILKEHRCDLYIYDLTDKNGTQKKAALEEIKVLDRQKVFDVGCVPFRVTLCKIAGNKYQLIISNHHILYDGWSTGIILREFFDVYLALASGNQPVKPPAKPSFKEFIQWSRNQDKTKQERFWQEYLASVDHPTALPIKKSRNEAGEIKGSVNTTMTLERSIKDRLEIFIKEHRLTLASFFYSTWGILLQRYCSTGDVIFGTTVSGRSAPIKGIQDMVGLFINTIPLRIKTDSGEKVKDLLGRVNDSVAIREKYESTPLVDIKEYSQLQSNVDLFDSLIVLENYPLDQRLMKKDSGLPLVADSYSIVESTNYDLCISITIGEVFRIDFIYHPTSLEELSISRLSSHFNNIIEYILINPGSEIFQIEMLSAEEKRQVLYDFNETEAAYPQDKTIHELFAGQAEQTPDHTALVCSEGTRGLAPLPAPISISYRELNNKSHQLANLLQAKGVKPDTIVGIMAERSLEMIIGIFAILKAGGAYLPIDPDYPKERINYILDDSKVKILVGKSNIFSNFSPGEDIHVISIDDISRDSPSPQAFNNSPKGAAVHLHLSPAPVTSSAYVLYTSGSTGKPKGVIVEHTSVVNIVWTMQNLYPLGPSETYLLKTAYVFDVSAAELFGWFLGGGRLAILEKGGEKDPGKILDIIERLAVTHINFVPSMFNSFVEGLNPGNIEKLSALKYIFLAGEVLLPGLVNKFKRFNTTIALENIYGPTEGTVYTTYYSLSRWQGSGSVPIGKPLANVTVYILNKYYQLQPMGIVGELMISGIGVARGYLNNPELTAEKFDQDLWDYRDYRDERKKMPGKKNSQKNRSPGSYKSYIFYKTGDLARWLPDGNIEFAGRIDYQVKIRGFRIELGEIENQLLMHKNIKEALVIAKKDPTCESYLCGYVTAEKQLDITQLREYLSQKLPDYMIPSFFVPLERIPLTPNGKIDRKSLPEPEAVSIVEYVAPRDEVEKKLAGIWSEVLARDTIGIDDNFFNLGGHSLKATRLLARIHKVFDIRLSLEEIFKHPSIRRLSVSIRKALTHEYESIYPVEKKEYYFLANAQQRLYILAQMEKENTHYNISAAFILEGVLHRERLEEAFGQLIKNSESLRTSFMMKGEEPVQVVHDRVEFKIEYDEMKEVEEGIEKGRVEGWRGRRVEEKEAPFEQDLNARGSHNPKSQELRANSYISSFIRPFDLSCAPLLRVGLIKLHTSPPLRGHPRRGTYTSQEGKEGKYLLMIDMHHIIADGTSTGIMINDFATLYGQQELPLLKHQYKDYSGWQNSEKHRATLKKQEEYWLHQVAGEIPRLNLPTDFTRPPIQGFEGRTLTFEIGSVETRTLKSFALEQNTSLFMVLLTLYNIFLTKLSGQEDILIGIPVAGRRHTDLENIIGMFVNTLVLRNNPADHKTFKEFLKEVSAKALQAFENQDYPYDHLVEAAVVERDASRNPFFDVMLAFQDINISQLKIPGLQVTAYPYENIMRTSKFDMTLYVEEINDHLKLYLEYSTRLFKPASIKRFIRYFKNITAAVVENPGKEIGEMEVITGDEKQQILFEFNDTGMEYPGHKVMGELFADQAQQTPDHIAVIGNQETRETHERIRQESLRMAITYRELNEKANQLAHLLIQKGVKPGTIIGLMVDRAIEMMIGLYGILKAGGAYIPVAPDYPPERVGYMLEDSGCALLLTQEKYRTSFTSGSEVLPLDHESLYHGLTRGNPPQESKPGNLVYVIYTSGSTGKPKGALIKTRGFINLVNWYVREFGLNAGDRYLLIAPISFDLAQKNLFAPLITGGCLCLAPPGLPDYYELSHYIATEQHTVINCAPTIFYPFVEFNSDDGFKKLTSLRYVFLGGEPIHMDKLESWLKSQACGVEIVNTYGPTECTDVVSYYRIPAAAASGPSIIPIGRPVDNVRLYVLDRRQKVLPVGFPGEIYIGGIGLAPGYCNNAELTAEKFKRIVISHSSLVISSSKPFPNDRSSKLYRTGDLGRWLGGGNIEFLGRLDQQVKIRGLRIELGEIECMLLRHDAVKEAAAAVIADEVRGNYLCAYIVFDKDQEFKVAELRGYLTNTLPDYMVPSFFVPLGKIPLTPNGKVDRKSLPEPKVETTAEYTAPRDEAEEKLAEIWSKVLEIEKESINIESNFFQLGGHSLKAVIMAAKVHKELETKISLAEIFRNPSIKGMSEYIRGMVKEKFASLEAAENKEYYPLSSAQTRMFFLNRMEGIGTAYNLPVVTGIRGKPDKHRFEKSLLQLIHRHESLRTSFRMKNETPVQVVHRKVDFQLENMRAAEYEIQGVINGFIKPFNLAQAPLFRVGLVELTGEKYLLLLDMHHIISDGVSMAILIREFIRIYEGKALPKLQIQYKDYSKWQERLFDTPRFKKQEEYWLDRFKGELPILKLPTDYIRPSVQRFDGDYIKSQLEEELTRRLKNIAAETDTTLFMILLAVFNILLAKYTGQEDIVVGIPASGRNHPDLEHLIGLCVNTLAIRNYVGENLSFKEFLEQVKKNAAQAYENQDYPIEMLINKLEIPKELSQNPLFNVLFVSENLDLPELKINELTFTPYEIELKISHLDLVFYFIEEHRRINMTLEYAAALFKPASIEKMLEHYIEILAQVGEDHRHILKDITISHRLTVPDAKIFQEARVDFEF